MIENQIKTVALLAILTGMMLFIGQLIGGASGLLIALIIVLVMNFVMYWFSDAIVLRIYRAKETEKSSKIYNLVKELARKAELPIPRVFIVPSKNPNAFATGRSPEHSSLACTEGILDLLNEEELKGVIAHELSHIKNRDTLITTIAATIAGVIGYVASMARWSALFGSRDRDNNSNLIQLLVLAILAPLIATILQLAISRQREYAADSRGAKITGKPSALADALIKIDQGAKQHPMMLGSPETSSLFIANPFSSKGIISLFSTHPLVEDRVAKLKKMKKVI